MPEEGQVLGGKYRLERLVGRGGFATVWAAKNLLLDRTVALKVLAPEQADRPGFLPRFLREAKLASRHIHENIVSVEDLDQTPEGLVYLVMELLEGETLGEMLRRRKRLPVAEALDVIIPTLAGLAAAHELNIIHRDIKPANVFLTTEEQRGPRVRVLDLGLAKDLIHDDGITINDQMFGTPSYLAPEFFVGTGVRRWAPSADVFACGMLLFRMLTGGLPFDRSVASLPSLEQFLARAEFYRKTDQLPGPALYQPAIPVAVDAVVRRALALEPGKRFAAAGDMLAALSRVSPSLGQTVVLEQRGEHTPPEPEGSAERADAEEPEEFDGGSTIFDPQPLGHLVGEDRPDAEAHEAARAEESVDPAACRSTQLQESPHRGSGDSPAPPSTVDETPQQASLAAGGTKIQWGPGGEEVPQTKLRAVTPFPGKVWARGGRSMWWGPLMAGAATFLLLSLGGTALLWHMRGRMPGSAVTSGANPEEAAQPTLSSIAPKASTKAGATDRAALPSVLLEVSTAPAGVTVTLDGVMLGTSPLQRILPYSESTHRLGLSAQGFQPQERTLSLRTSQSFKIQLEPAGR